MMPLPKDATINRCCTSTSGGYCGTGCKCGNDETAYFEMHPIEIVNVKALLRPSKLEKQLRKKSYSVIQKQHERKGRKIK